MVQTLLPLLPAEDGNFALALLIGGAVIGVLLWALGARFSRPIICLLFVGIGAALGNFLPGKFGWQFNAQAVAVGGAVVLGVIGWLGHRIWVGALLGIVLSVWTVIAFVAITSRPFTLAAMGETPMPLAVAAMLSGISMTVMWPRAACVALYSIVGASAMAIAGLFAMQNYRPQWIVHVPAQTWMQMAVLGGVVLFGAILQWMSSPRRNGSREIQAEG
jgi:hypothetical protein